MVEWEGDQVSPLLLDLSQKVWVTEHPITLQDSPPSFRDGAAFTVITEVVVGEGEGVKESTSVVTLTYAH